MYEQLALRSGSRPAPGGAAIPAAHDGTTAFAPPAANDQSFPPVAAPWREPPYARAYRIAALTTAEQHGLASALVRRRFAWRGYATDAPGQRADGDRLTLAAWQYDELVATLTLVRDAPGALPSETVYASEIAHLRRAGRVLCEVSRFAVDPDYSCPELLRSLFACALDHGHRRLRASDIVIGVNPRHAAYYQRRMGFRQIGGRRHYPRVDAPVVLLHQTLDGLASTSALKR